MDGKELALYYEEQRQALIDLNKGIAELRQILQTDKVNQVELASEPTVNVSNQLDSVKVNNIDEIEKSLEKLSKTLEMAIKNNSYKPLKSVKVDNIKDAKPSELKVSNLNDIKTYFDDLITTIKDNQPIVNVAKQDIIWPTNPKQPVAVRLSDGKSFYNAIVSAITSSSTPKQNYDYVDIQQTNSTTETYVYKSGGVNGTIMKTIVVTYTDSTKADLDSISYL